MRSKLIAILLPVLLIVGCGTVSHPPSGALPSPSWSFPPDARITQRGILTARGRQFALNGFLSRSETGGLRLLITESFGQRLADVLVKPDGKVIVMHSSRMLRPAWISRYVARDLVCVFGQPPQADPAVTMPDLNHFLIQRPWYTLDLRVVQVETGPQTANHFDPALRDPP